MPVPGNTTINRMKGNLKSVFSGRDSQVKINYSAALCKQKRGTGKGFSGGNKRCLPCPNTSIYLVICKQHHLSLTF